MNNLTLSSAWTSGSLKNWLNKFSTGEATTSPSLFTVSFIGSYSKGSLSKRVVSISSATWVVRSGIGSPGALSLKVLPIILPSSSNNSTISSCFLRMYSSIIPKVSSAMSLGSAISTLAFKYPFNAAISSLISAISSGVSWIFSPLFFMSGYSPSLRYLFKVLIILAIFHVGVVPSIFAVTNFNSGTPANFLFLSWAFNLDSALNLLIKSVCLSNQLVLNLS